MRKLILLFIELVLSHGIDHRVDPNCPYVLQLTPIIENSVNFWLNFAYLLGITIWIQFAVISALMIPSNALQHAIPLTLNACRSAWDMKLTASTVSYKKVIPNSIIFVENRWNEIKIAHVIANVLMVVTAVPIQSANAR